MKCPYCSSTNLKVADKRNNYQEATIRRRRECLNCHKRFTTYERIENIDLFVVKTDGKIETFNREKIKKGILKAFSKNPTPDQLLQIEKIMDGIEQRIINSKTSSIRSSEVGKYVLNNLLAIDPIAYLRFASIYKHFSSIADFEKELKNIKN